MSHPFSFFRQYQALMFAVLGVLCIVVFVIGDPLSNFIYGGGNDRGDPVVYDSKSGPIHRSTLMDRIQSRNATRFLVASVRMQASPSEPPQRISQQVDFQFPRPGEDESLASYLMAKQADQLGVTISDDAVNGYIKEISKGAITNNDLAKIVSDVAEQAFGQGAKPHRVFEALRHELKILQLRQFVEAGLQGSATLTPAEKWAYFQRMRTMAQVELLPLSVAQAADSLEIPEPTDAVLQNYFEQYKDREPNPDLPTPGFRDPYRAKFRYVVADPDAVAKDCEKDVPEAEILARYVKEKETRFKRTFTDPLSSPEAPAATAPATLPATTEKPAEPAKTEPAKTEPAKTEPAKPAEPAKSEPAKTEPAKPAEPAKTEPKAEEKPAAKPEEKPADKPAEPAKTESKAEEKPAAKPEEKPAVKPAEPAKPEEKPAEPAKPEETPKSDGSALVLRSGDVLAFADGDAKESKEPATPAAATTPAGTAAAATTSAAPAATGSAAATTTAAAATTGTAAPAGTSAPAAPVVPVVPPAPKVPLFPIGTDLLLPAGGDLVNQYRQLDELARDPTSLDREPPRTVRETLRAEIAGELAAKRIDAVFQKVADAVDAYSYALLDAKKKAAEPDWASFYKGYAGFSLETTENLSFYDLRELTGLGRSFDVERREAFAAFALDQLILYSPVKTETFDQAGSQRFVVWKIEESGREALEKPPTFAAKKGEVLRAWREEQARDKLKVLAQAFVDGAKSTANLRLALEGEPGKALKAALGGKTVLQVTDPPSFTWMRQPDFSGGMMGQMRLNEVFGVPLPGAEFMQSVFALATGQCGVAVNQPATYVYVVRMTSRSEPAIQQFVGTPTFLWGPMLARDRAMDMGQWYQQLQTEYRVVARKPPAE